MRTDCSPACRSTGTSAARSQIGHVNKLDFEIIAPVMIRDRDTGPGARSGWCPPRNASPEMSNPLNQTILPAEIVARSAEE